MALTLVEIFKTEHTVATSLTQIIQKLLAWITGELPSLRAKMIIDLFQIHATCLDPPQSVPTVKVLQTFDFARSN